MKTKNLLLLGLAISICFTACDRNLEKGSPEVIKKEEVKVIKNETTEPKPEKPSIAEPLDESRKELLMEKPEEEKLPPLPLEIDEDSLQNFSSEVIKWGFGPQFNEKGRSVSCEGLQERFKDFNVAFIDEDKPVIHLTFDEGYENGYTSKILDVLKEKGVKGTFFITGDYYRREPDLIRRMIDEGHVVGSHSDHHIDFSTATTEKILDDVIPLHENIRKDFDYEMRCFRFPSGAFSEKSLEIMRQLGYKSIFWSFGYKDWDPKNQMSPDAAFQKVKNGFHPGEIMLLHTVGETNCQILGDLIDCIKECGYEIEPIE